MANLNVRICSRPQCKKIYTKDTRDKYCACGALIIESNQSNDQNTRDRKPAAKSMKAHLVLLLDDGSEKIFALSDRCVIGVSSESNTPDIDLRPYVGETKVSKKHALIYKDRGGYFIKNTSKNHSVHLNEKAIVNEPVKLQSGDMIVLSKAIVFQFEEV